MKHKLLKGASILTAVLMLSMLVTPVLAGPVQPFNRWGYAYDNGASPFNGQEIYAWIDGVSYGMTTTDGVGLFSIDTYGDDTTPDAVKTGGYNGDTVFYTAGPLTTSGTFFAETDTWTVGGFNVLNADLNEVAASPALLKIDSLASQSGYAADDYFVVYNPSGAPVDLSGFSYAIGGGATQGVLVGGTLCSDSVNPVPAGGWAAIDVTGQFSTTGNSIILLETATGFIVDRVEYGTIAAEPENTMMPNAAAPGAGLEIYRQPTQGTDTNDCAVDFATQAAVDHNPSTDTATATGPTNDPNWSNVAAITITYTWTGTPTGVDLYYTTNGGTNWALAGSDASVDGSFGWSCPADGQYAFFAVSDSESAPVDGVDTPEHAGTYNYDGSAPTVDAGISHGVMTAAFLQDATADFSISGPAAVGAYAWTGDPEVLFSDATIEDPTVSASVDGGPYTATLTVTDAAGNTNFDTFTFSWDASSPTITNTVPADAGTCGLTADIVITFSEPIDTATFTWNIVPDPGLWTPVWSGGNTIVTLSHANPYTDLQVYDVTVTAADDVAGNPLVAGAVPNPWSFTAQGGVTFGPAAPTDLRCKVVGEQDTATDLWVNWTDEAAAVSYNIYRGVTPDAMVFQANVLQGTGTWTDAGAIAGSAFYYYNIRSLDAGGVEGPSSSMVAKYTTSLVAGWNALGSPFEYFPETCANGHALCDWKLIDDDSPDAIPSASSLSVYTGSWVSRLPGTPEFAPHREINSLEDGIMAYMDAPNDYTWVGWSAEQIRMHGHNQAALAAPANFDIGPSGDDLVLTWDPVGGADHYEVFTATSRALENFNFGAPVYSGGLTTWTDTNGNITLGETYYIVIAVDAGGLFGDSTNALGKYTREFDVGWNAFTTPFAPYQGVTCPPSGDDLCDWRLIDDDSSEAIPSASSLSVYTGSWVSRLPGTPEFAPHRLIDPQGDGCMVYMDALDIYTWYT